MNTKVIIILFALLVTPISSQYNSSYDIAEIYESIIPDFGTLGETSFGEIVELESIYIVSKIDLGRYSVTVTRKDQDFYKIDGTNIFIKTRYCYEYSYSQDAILIIDSQSGFNKGKIIFLE